MTPGRRKYHDKNNS